MESENDSSDNELNVEEPLITRSTAGKRNPAKVPKKIHKAHREKLKREHLNDLFLKLADGLELNEQNSGKAAILDESIRLLKRTLAQIEILRSENKMLSSESQYVTLEKTELQEENSVLSSQVDKLLAEIKVKKLQSKPDLNAAPPEFHQQELVSLQSEDHLRFTDAEQQPPFMHGPVLVIPIGPELQTYPQHGQDQVPLLSSKPTSVVGKPCARYPDSSGSWPPRILEEQLNSSVIPRNS